MDLCEFEVSLVYRASSRTVKAVTQRNHVSKNEKGKKEPNQTLTKKLTVQVWRSWPQLHSWSIPVVSAVGRWMREGQECEASLSYIPCLSPAWAI